MTAFKLCALASFCVVAVASAAGYEWDVDTPSNGRNAKLVDRAKQIIDKGIGVTNPEDLADDFVFVAPVYGPFNKDDWVGIVQSLHVKQAFPDFKANCFGFTVDPFEPNRVWWFSRPTGTHTGDSPRFGSPTGRFVEGVPQVYSLVLNDEGKAIKFTAGYPADREVGNTGGLGGGFGFLYAIGRPLPIPEGKPWTPSWAHRMYFTYRHFMDKITQPAKRRSDL